MQAAAALVSRIVETTNDAYSRPMPRILSTDVANAAEVQVNADKQYAGAGIERSANTKRPHVIEDDSQEVQPATMQGNELDTLDLESDLSLLSPDKCGKIVDSLFDKVDARVLSPPGKRARFSPTAEVDTIALTLPLV